MTDPPSSKRRWWGLVAVATAAMVVGAAAFFQSRDEAFTQFKDFAKDTPDIAEGVKQEDLPESFRVTVLGPEFACASLSAIRALPGVSDPRAALAPSGSRPGAEIKSP